MNSWKIQISKKKWDALEAEFSIVQALIDARESAGLTQSELARITGIAQGDISKIENGNGNPSIKTLKRLAHGMGKSLRIEFVDPDEKNKKVVWDPNLYFRLIIGHDIWFIICLLWLLRSKRSLRSSWTPNSTCKVSAVKGAIRRGLSRPLTADTAGATSNYRLNRKNEL